MFPLANLQSAESLYCVPASLILRCYPSYYRSAIPVISNPFIGGLESGHAKLLTLPIKCLKNASEYWCFWYLFFDFTIC